MRHLTAWLLLASLLAPQAEAATKPTIPKESQRAIERARFPPGSRLMPKAPDPKVLSMWILLPRALPQDEALVCQVQQAAARSKAELRVFLMPVGGSPAAYQIQKQSCISSVGASPITKAGVERWWGRLQGYEPLITAHYQGNKATKPLSLWKTALQELR